MVAIEAVEHSDAVDAALHLGYLAFSMFSMLHSGEKYIQVYTLRDGELGDWVEVGRVR